MRESTIQKLLLAVAAYHLALGGWFLLGPGSAYDSLAEFPPRNDHFLRDVSSFYLAFGIAFWVASRRASWRAPVLSLAIVQYLIHTVVHVFDVGDAASDGKGIFSAVSLGVLTVVLVFLLGAVARREEAPPREARGKPQEAGSSKPQEASSKPQEAE